MKRRAKSTRIKGFIFSLGLVLGAAGEVSAAERGAFDAPGEKTFIENILDKTAELGRLTLADFTGRPSEETPGMRAHRDYGLTGIRGEAAAGFPSIQTPLLALCSLPEADLDARRLLEALFEIMRELDDTTLVRRGGIEALQSVKRCARDLLESGALCQASWRDALHTVDREFVARRLSPGGAADCLSVMLFLIWPRTGAVKVNRRSQPCSRGIGERKHRICGVYLRCNTNIHY